MLACKLQHVAMPSQIYGIYIYPDGLAILEQNIKLSLCIMLFRGVAIGKRYIGYAQEIIQCKNMH